MKISESCRAGSHRGRGDHGRGRLAGTGRPRRRRRANQPSPKWWPPAVAADCTLPATETVAADADWEKVVPGGDCACADGSEFNFWVREADPAKVVLFLEGGGACFDPTTCAFTERLDDAYDWNISPDDDPSLMSGIFDFANPTEPVRRLLVRLRAVLHRRRPSR